MAPGHKILHFVSDFRSTDWDTGQDFEELNKQIDTLLDIPIMGRGVFNLDQLGSALLLARFMVAVPIGAVAGGFLASRWGGRWTALFGLVAAAAGFAWRPGRGRVR